MGKGWLKGIVVGSTVSTVVMLATSAMAGTGIGAVFNLGKTNTVNAQSTLNGAASGKNLQITNTGSGGGLGIKVGAGRHPIVVNAGAGLATNLNADKLDGLRASAFLRSSAEAYALVKPSVPSFVSGYTKNFTAVSSPYPGIYCLTPAAGINPANRVAMVTAEWGNSANSGPYIAYIYAAANDCGAGKFEVETSSTTVAFEIFVPAT